MKYKLSYFKSSGKWYSDDEIVFEDLSENDFWKAIDRVQQMLLSEKEMPGLIGCWYGPVLIKEILDDGSDGLIHLCVGNI